MEKGDSTLSPLIFVTKPGKSDKGSNAWVRSSTPSVETESKQRRSPIFLSLSLYLSLSRESRKQTSDFVYSKYFYLFLLFLRHLRFLKVYTHTNVLFSSSFPPLFLLFSSSFPPLLPFFLIRFPLLICP